MVDGNIMGEVKRVHADGLGVVKDEHETWTKGPRAED
jgi:hypothetical protein